MNQPHDYLGLLRHRGLELCEQKRIDDYAYHKARYTIYGAGDVEKIQTVIDWLETQPDWTEDEFLAPEWYKESLRDSEMLGRESAAYERSQQDRRKQWESWQAQEPQAATSTSIHQDNSLRSA